MGIEILPRRCYLSRLFFYDSSFSLLDLARVIIRAKKVGKNLENQEERRNSKEFELGGRIRVGGERGPTSMNNLEERGEEKRRKEKKRSGGN